jgi:predicted dithiol-disulfide oxidoreductase (DUF899 family)
LSGTGKFVRCSQCKGEFFTDHHLLKKELPTMTTTAEIIYPPVVSRAEWLKARRRLLADEKELTKARDRVNTQRRELPMVRIDKDYVFEGPSGKMRFLDLFRGRPQLIVYHFMWRWEKGRPLDEPCRGCAGWADQISRGQLSILRARNTELALVSRAPLNLIASFKMRMGWTLPWYSSAGGNFNYDFNVSLDASIAPLMYNYRTPEEHVAAGTGYYFQGEQPFDLPGISSFLHEGGEFYHTYSTYGRGAEGTGDASALLDLTAFGRQETWEEPKGRAAGGGLPPRPDLMPYPDEYEA